MSSPSSPTDLKELGKEVPEKNEEEYIRRMINVSRESMLRLYKDKKMLRKVHPKLTGCAKAEFIVSDGLEERFKKGLFSKPSTFPCWVRFSNGKSEVQADGKKDIRGVSIKVMNVPGDKILSREKDSDTQDFIFLSHPTFVAKTLKEFSKTQKAASSKNKINLLLYFLNPFHWKVLGRTIKSFIHCKHPFELRYYSVTPFRLGDAPSAVKYALLPSSANELEIVDTESYDYLSKNIAATLKKHEAVFDFCVQEQKDPVKMPVEDATVEWTSPFIKLATIRIPTQVTDTPERLVFGDNIAFNPWHSLPEHRPIGNFNRCRKSLYEELYEFRHAHNDVPNEEPAASPGFFNDTNI